MSRFIEERIVGKVVKCLKDAGDPVAYVNDGEELVVVGNRKEAIEATFAVDEAYLFTVSGSWVRVVLGNGTDVICDYTVDLEEILAPAFALAESYDR